MPTVPIGLQAYKRNDGFVPEVRCLNMYAEKDETGISPDGTLRLQRPGTARIASLAGEARALGRRSSDGSRLGIFGAKLYDDEVAVGDITGGGLAPMASTAFYQSILGGSQVYVYDTALTPVTMPDDAPTAIDLDQLNGYTIVLTETGRFYWIVPGETTIDALDFATAESSADKGVAVRRIGDELWFFGDESTEVWQSTGDADAPFQRVSGRQYQRGCGSRDSVRRFDNTLFWVGEDGQVYRGGAVPQVVSTNGIAERIRKRTAPTSAWTFAVDGHDFYVLNVPGEGTFCFDPSTGEWPEFASGDGVGWAPLVGYTYGGKTVCGSDGSLWNLSPDIPGDNAAPFLRLVTGTVGLMGKVARNDSLCVGVGASSDCTVRLRWKDGQDEYPDYYDELDVRAPMDVTKMYRIGQPDEPYRTFEVSCNELVRIRIAGMKVNEAWG